jgi:hypothetical protein
MKALRVSAGAVMFAQNTMSITIVFVNPLRQKVKPSPSDVSTTHLAFG